jgi:hypothetical protein
MGLSPRPVWRISAKAVEPKAADVVIGAAADGQIGEDFADRWATAGGWLPLFR